MDNCPPRHRAVSPRLDSLHADGPPGTATHICLADGNCLALVPRPGQGATAPTVFDEVCLSPGLKAPATSAWAETDAYGLFLECGATDATLHRNVPAEAVRELINQHGGEHAEPDNPPAGT